MERGRGREREREREGEGERIHNSYFYMFALIFSVQESVGEAEESGGLPWTLQEDERKA